MTADDLYLDAQDHPTLHHIDFLNTRLTCLEWGDGIFVAMRPVVEGMGLAWQPQHRKLTDARDRFCVTLMVMQMPGDDQAREHVFIPLERLFGWLMTIHPNRVHPDQRDTVLAYQHECDRVLLAHFLHDLHSESYALRTLRPTTVAVARMTADGLCRAEIAATLGKSVSAITYHRRSARRLGLLAA